MTYRMLDASTLEALHELVIEPHQLQGCDRDMLDSCLHGLVNKIHYEGVADTHEAAAVVVESIALGHSFSDGNKRTSLMSMVAFYRANHHGLPNVIGTDIAKKIEALVEHELSVVELASWLRQLPILTKKQLRRISPETSRSAKNSGPLVNSKKGARSRW